MEDIDRYASKIGFLETSGANFLLSVQKTQVDFGESEEQFESSINSLKQNIQILNLELHQVKLDLLQVIKMLRERTSKNALKNVENKVEHWGLHEKISKSEFSKLFKENLK